MLFWIVTTLLALTVAVLLALALMRARGPSEPPAAYDLRVYRDQLKEVDRDLARGVIGEADAERTRMEISRRILAADAELQSQGGGTGGSRRLAVVPAILLAVALSAGGALLYRQLGAPGYADLPRDARIAAAERAYDARPDQATAEADAPRQPAPDADPKLLELMVQLRAKMAETPDDLRGQNLLAQYEYALGNYAAAHAAQTDVIRLRGADATSEDYSRLAEMMILAAGGYVSPEAERALDHAVELDPKNGAARFFQGLLLAQIGRPDLAFSLWDRLLRESPPEAPWVGPIEAQIGDLARLAGVEYDPRPPVVAALPGPSQEDVDAAADMTAEDRANMIRTMVDGLEMRLGSEGGTPEEWARLIGALGVLGDADRAAAALAGARAAYPDDAQALAAFDAAAARAGIGQ